uniref:Uncharacterized protein n=1 Tax=Arundo donax TaxID=35708 RepID=A0A0A8Z951_ARUDO
MVKMWRLTRTGSRMTATSTAPARTAMHIHLRLLFWYSRAVSSSTAPRRTKELACATWLSMSFSWCPCASTSAAMSRNTWCRSSRLRSISFTASCRSWISEMVSSTCPRPCSWIAFCRNVSLSPDEMSASIVPSSAFSPVTV